MPDLSEIQQANAVNTVKPATDGRHRPLSGADVAAMLDQENARSALILRRRYNRRVRWPTITASRAALVTELYSALAVSF